MIGWSQLMLSSMARRLPCCCRGNRIAAAVIVSDARFLQPPIASDTLQQLAFAALERLPQ